MTGKCGGRPGRYAGMAFRNRCNAGAARDTSGYAPPVPTDSQFAALDDGALARRIAGAGATPDSSAEAELYRRLAPRVRLYGMRHLRDRTAAADLAQQVLLMTIERLRAGEVREPERIASFVLGACRMTVIEMKRGERRREDLLEVWSDKEQVFEAPEPVALDPDRLAGCLEALAERERSVVVLSFFADKPADEVGSELGITGGNVRVIRHRALGRLRDCMGADV
jgi:RNA polymerase sigma-70 factor (ECF subfamily)